MLGKECVRESKHDRQTVPCLLSDGFAIRFWVQSAASLLCNGYLPYNLFACIENTVSYNLLYFTLCSWLLALGMAEVISLPLVNIVLMPGSTNGFGKRLWSHQLCALAGSFNLATR